jgi:S1-C subfamily serine protease
MKRATALSGISGLWWLAGASLATSMATGCAHATREATAPDAAEAREASSDTSTCKDLGALVDLHGEIVSAPTATNAPLAALADTQAELAAARAALAGLDRTDPLRAKVARLASLLEERRAALEMTTKFASESHAAAASALREASTCRGIDLAALSAATSKRSAKTEDLSIARSKACEPTLRVWAVTEGLDLTSVMSVSRVATQLADVRLSKADAPPRDRLAAALARHAENLKALENESDPTKLIDARKDVREATENAYRTCLSQRAPRTAAKDPPKDPRSATVMVRPAWSGALKRLPSASALRFGSGFVVRWHGGTFVVTNRHVMDGAVEADILFAADVENVKRDKRATRTAKLVGADESDDVAVLRVDDANETLPALSFRLEPAREQELVVAAGFPGVGAMPSFQVTRGIVSNAHFASEEQDAGIAYVQHTAAIDPGNSGGPLLDDAGRLVGMNTAKMNGRENVSFAIPTSRLRFALSRAEHPRHFDVMHAEAACNVLMDGLAAERPSMTAVRRLGLSLFDESTHRARPDLRAEAESPTDEARVRAFEAVRDAVDAAAGIAPFATCTDVAARDKEKFVANVRAKNGTLFRVVLASETDELRVVSFSQLRGGT